jgi:hypothetical protein
VNSLKSFSNSAYSLVVTLVFVGLSAIVQTTPVAAQELTPDEQKGVRAAVGKASPVSFWAVTQDFDGNFDSVDAHMATFKQQAIAQKIPNANPVGILVLHEDPTGKSRFRMSVGVALSQRVDVKAPLKVEQMSFSRAVRYMNVGPYDRLKAVGPGIEKILKEPPPGKARGRGRNVRWPVVLKLIDDPKKVNPKQLKTELIMPIQ